MDLWFLPCGLFQGGLVWSRSPGKEGPHLRVCVCVCMCVCVCVCVCVCSQPHPSTFLKDPVSAVTVEDVKATQSPSLSLRGAWVCSDTHTVA